MRHLCEPRHPLERLAFALADYAGGASEVLGLDQRLVLAAALLLAAGFSVWAGWP